MLNEYQKILLEKAKEITGYEYEEVEEDITNALDDVIDYYNALKEETEDDDCWEIPSDYELDQEFMEMNRMC